MSLYYDIWEAVEEIEAKQTIEQTDYLSIAVDIDVANVQAINVEVLELGDSKGGLSSHVLDMEEKLIKLLMTCYLILEAMYYWA